MTRNQILISVLIIALLSGIVFAANSILTPEKRKIAQGLSFAPTPPVPDGEITAGDRTALAGVYAIEYQARTIGVSPAMQIIRLFYR